MRRWAIWIGVALIVGIALLLLSLVICLDCQLG